MQRTWKMPRKLPVLPPVLLAVWLSVPAVAQFVPPDLKDVLQNPVPTSDLNIDPIPTMNFPGVESIPLSKCHSYTEEEVAMSRQGLPELVYGDITLSADLRLNNLDSRVEDVIVGCMLFAPNPVPFNLSDVPSSDRLLKGGSVGMAICKSGDLSTTKVDIPIYVPRSTLGSTWGGYACAIWFRTADTEAQAGDKAYLWTRVEGGTDMLVHLMGAFPK